MLPTPLPIVTSPSSASTLTDWECASSTSARSDGSRSPSNWAERERSRHRATLPRGRPVRRRGRPGPFIDLGGGEQKVERRGVARLAPPRSGRTRMPAAGCPGRRAALAPGAGHRVISGPAATVRKARPRDDAPPLQQPARSGQATRIQQDGGLVNHPTRARAARHAHRARACSPSNAWASKRRRRACCPPPRATTRSRRAAARRSDALAVDTRGPIPPPRARNAGSASRCASANRRKRAPGRPSRPELERVVDRLDLVRMTRTIRVRHALLQQRLPQHERHFVPSRPRRWSSRRQI